MWRCVLTCVACLVLVGCGTDEKRITINRNISLMEQTTTKVKSLREKITSANEKMVQSKELDLSEAIKACEELKKFCKDEATVTNDPIEAAYIGVYLWKLAVEKAGSTDVNKVRAAFKDGIEFDAPSGKVKLDPKTQHLYKPFMIGKIRNDRQFDIIYKTSLIEPVPYPPVAFPGWSCDWTKGGVIKGLPAVLRDQHREASRKGVAMNHVD